MERWISGLGLISMIGFAWLMSSHKRQFPWRLVATGLVLQFGLAWLILGNKNGRKFFQFLR